MTDRGDVSGDTVRLTYAELAEKLGVEVASAKRRTLRAGWRRTLGNDGRVRADVPLTALEAPAPPAAPVSRDSPPDIHARLRDAEAALEAVRLELEAVRLERARLTGVVDGLRAAEAAAQDRRKDAEAALERLRRRGLVARIMNLEG